MERILEYFRKHYGKTISVALPLSLLAAYMVARSNNPPPMPTLENDGHEYYVSHPISTVYVVDIKENYLSDAKTRLIYTHDPDTIRLDVILQEGRSLKQSSISKIVLSNARESIKKYEGR